MRQKLLTYTCSILLLFCFLAPSVNAEGFDVRNRYAVVWTIDTDDAGLFNQAIAEQATKTLELWTNGTIENVYFDAEKIHDVVNKGDAARVTFFIKAKTDGEAKEILDEMPLVKEKVAKYTLHRVGMLWLTQF